MNYINKQKEVHQVLHDFTNSQSKIEMGHPGRR